MSPANTYNYSSRDAAYYRYSDRVLPETVASKTDQPAMSFVRVVVGNSVEVTTLPPKCVISFEINRIEGNGEEFTIQLFDDNWEELEHLLSASEGHVNITYGYVGGETKSFTGQLSDYSIDFNSTGTILTASGVSLSSITNMSSLMYDTGTLNPTEAVANICRKMGWKVYPENFDASENISSDTLESFSLKDDHPIQYIKNKLAPLAIRSSDGSTGYKFYLDESLEPPVAYFKPVDVQADTLRTYVYMKGVDSAVLDLQLSVNGIFGAAGTSLVTTNLNSSFIDPITKDTITIDKDINSSRVYATGRFTHTKSGVSSESIDAAGRSPSQMNALLNYRVSIGTQNGVYPYSGIMQIIGDPTIKFKDTIRLIIITDSGHLHHTSGLYRIENINDSVTNGFYITSLSIWKDANIEGGIEILNPRVLIK